MTCSQQRVIRHLAIFLALSFSLTVAALAQVTTADITGRVLDPNGAAVPNASVSVRNTGTSQTRTAQTNEEGDYTITQLPPGTYEVSPARVTDNEI